MSSQSLQDSPQSSSAQQLLAEIYRRRQVEHPEGYWLPLHSEVTPDEAALLQAVIREHQLTRSLEIGCAFGLSSLIICDAIANQTDQPHLIFDPFQSSEWKNIGLTNLRRAGLTNFELHEERSEFALPRLLHEGHRFDFALIDGYHTFDQTLLEFYYLDRLLDVGGVVVVDDLQLPGVRFAARFIAKLPNYAVLQGARPRQTLPSWKRKLVDASLRGLAKLLPDRLRRDAFADTLFHSDVDLRLNYEMIAFQKTGPDQRSSHWFQPF